jgi:UDP-N-acetylmuramate: L-alanyl-gamma-D-glutamyl-meso-diaminopimelate ligase
MAASDEALVYFNPQVVAHKRLEMITKEDVSQGFESRIEVANKTEDVLAFIENQLSDKCVVLMMSSGNFDGIDFDRLGEKLLVQVTNGN